MLKRKQLDQFSSRLRTEWFEHFISTPATGINVIGVGGSVTYPASTNSAGIARISTGTSSTGTYGLRYYLSMFHPGSVGIYNTRVSFRWRIPHVPDVAESFIATFGLGNLANPGEPNIGFYFLANNLGRLMAMSNSSGTKTNQDMGEFSPNTWLESAIILAKNNSVIYQTQLTGSDSFLTHKITSNINSTSAITTFGTIVKSLGMTARNIDFDYFALEFDRDMMILL